MFDLIRAVVEVIVDIVTGGGTSTEQPDPSDPCNATECVDAKERLAAERGALNTICIYLKTLQIIWDIATAITATPIWVIVFLIILAVLSPLIGFLVFVFLAAYAFSWILVILVLPRIIAEAAIAWAEQAEVVNESINAVIANCPDHCRGDISRPEPCLNRTSFRGR